MKEELRWTLVRLLEYGQRLDRGCIGCQQRPCSPGCELGDALKALRSVEYCSDCGIEYVGEHDYCQ